MTTKELIREKIDSFYAEYKAKFHQNGEPYNLGIIDGLDMAERILDTLPDEPVTDCHELTEAAEKYASGFPFANEWQSIANNAFIAGAGWMAKQQPLPEDSVAFQKGVQEGRRLEREDVKSTIQSRIDEILGDAQPNPVLRMELQELIKKIEA